MHRPHLGLLAPLLVSLPACAIERLEAIFDEHGQTYVTTDAPGSDTTAGDTSTGTGDAGGDTSTGAAASTGGASAGQEASSEPATGTTSTSTTGTSEESTGPDPVCGNGVLEPFGLLPEECDDGNLNSEDGCDETCAADRIMFVSSGQYEAGYFKSLHLADATCAQTAEDVGLPNWLNFRAWLSDSKTDARDRIALSRGRIVLVNGLVVADSWTDLLAGKLHTPIEVTEKGETYHGGVWTGTDPQGVGVVGATHCDDWTSFSAKKSAYYGYSDRATPEWTLSALDDNPSPCILDFAVYCLEQR